MLAPQLEKCLQECRFRWLLPCPLNRYLLQAYPRSDVFVVASLDHTSWKLFMLSTVSNLVSFSVTPQSTIDESLYPTHILQVPSIQVRQPV